MQPFKFIPSDRRPIERIDTSGMVAAFQAKGGVIRRFEANVRTDYDNVKLYLLEHGYQLSMVRNMNTLKKIGAPGKAKAMHWSRIMQLVDELRASEGKEPFKARRAA